jgi:hypothetical protein
MNQFIYYPTVDYSTVMFYCQSAVSFELLLVLASVFYIGLILGLNDRTSMYYLVITNLVVCL